MPSTRKIGPNAGQSVQNGSTIVFLAVADATEMGKNEKNFR